MREQEERVLEEAIELEMNMSDLYALYADNFKGDRDFWSQMSEEESNHARLLRLAKDIFSTFPDQILYKDMEELKKTNKDIKKAIEKYRKKLPPEKEGYEYAINLEKTCFELQYQQMMEQSADSERVRVLQVLNNEDRDHAKRIEELLSKK